MASVSKEFHRLLKRVGKLTDGQVSIADIDWDDGDVKKFYLTITPNNGYYKSGRFKFEVKIPDDYPVVPPIVWCHTEIYHPNIDTTEENYGDSSTNVCLNVLEAGTWTSSFGLEGAILGLLFLMHNPNLQDPLSPYFEGAGDEEYFQENVKKYMLDEEFDDMSFNKDFKVIDDILYENTMPSTEPIMENTVEDPEKTKDLMPITDMKNNNEENCIEEDSKPDKMNAQADVTTYEVIDRCALNVEDTEKPVELDENNDENRQNASKEITEREVYSKDTGVMKDQDEGIDRQIELVNIDGDCVLLIHRYTGGDDDIPTDDFTHETNSTALATDNETVSNINVTDKNAQVNVENGLTPPDNACNIENTSNEGTVLHQDDSGINILSPDTNQDTRDKDNDNSKRIGCGTWYTFRTALRKLVYAIGHNKLYRDLGF